MFSQGTVTVVTAATGHPNLGKCLQSVQAQRYPYVEHLVVIDGPDFQDAARAVVDGLKPANKPVSVLSLPHNTGRDNWCGHRVYAASSFLINTEFIAFLDEDNWYEPDHIQSLVLAIQQAKALWAFSLRNIVSEQGDLIGPDICESLGNLHHVWTNPNDVLIDTNCYLLRREIAVQFAPVWYGPTRPPPGEMERDRAMCRLLLQHCPQSACNRKHTVNYSVGNRGDSVQAEFFIRGNEAMRKQYPNGLPWEINRPAKA